MQLFLRAPKHVYLLRGNHEYYIEHEGKVLGAVRPSEAMNTLKPHLSQEVFAHYMRLFDALPNMLFFERILFVHGGIARDLLLKQKYKDLSSLNEWDIRFQMMWSDPSSADVIPATLQEQSSRFASDIAKRQSVPIFHVNAEDPEAVVRVGQCRPMPALHCLQRPHAALSSPTTRRPIKLSGPSRTTPTNSCPGTPVKFIYPRESSKSVRQIPHAPTRIST